MDAGNNTPETKLICHANFNAFTGMKERSRNFIQESNGFEPPYFALMIVKGDASRQQSLLFHTFNI